MTILSHDYHLHQPMNTIQNDNKEDVQSLDLPEAPVLVRLVSQDGIVYTINKKYVELSSVMKESLEDSDHVNFSSIHSSTLKEIVKYLEHHQGVDPGIIPTPFCDLDMKKAKVKYVAKRHKTTGTKGAFTGHEIVEYVKRKDQAHEDKQDPVDPWDVDFINSVTYDWDNASLENKSIPHQMIALTKATNYLAIDFLLRLCCAKFASMMKRLKKEAADSKNPSSFKDLVANKLFGPPPVVTQDDSKN